jgi:predicted hotdog family 3-hydroxylacyl-ACP dehydratase
MTGAANETIGREALARLVPHAHLMCLLERVVSHGEHSIQCVAESHRRADNPLRRDGRLAALHLVEYAAQAMAVHGALTAGGKVRPGMLAALREIRLHAAFIECVESELVIEAIRRYVQPAGSLYEFRVQGDGRVLAEGRIAIALFT